MGSGGPRIPVSTSWGSVLNYTLFGSETSGLKSRQATFNGGSASLDARMFSPYGTLSQTGILGTTTTRDMTALRLETSFALFGSGIAHHLSGRRLDFRRPWLDPPDTFRRRPGAAQFRHAVGSRHRAVAVVLRQRGGAVDARCLPEQFQDLHPGGAAGTVPGQQSSARLRRRSAAGVARCRRPRGRDDAAVLHVPAVAARRPDVFLRGDGISQAPLRDRIQQLRRQGIRLDERAPWAL